MSKGKLMMTVGSIMIASSMLVGCAGVTATPDKIKSVTAHELRIPAEQIEISNQETTHFGNNVEWDAKTPKGDYNCMANDLFTFVNCTKAGEEPVNPFTQK